MYDMKRSTNSHNSAASKLPIVTSKKQYLKYLIEKVELLIKRTRWKALMCENNPYQEPVYHFDLKSRKSPLQHPNLVCFENDLLKLVKNISFTTIQNDF